MSVLVNKYNFISRMAFANMTEAMVENTELNKPRNAFTSFKPIAVKVDLSQKSFMPSINTNQRQELCITIFYNGKSVHIIPKITRAFSAS